VGLVDETADPGGIGSPKATKRGIFIRTGRVRGWRLTGAPSVSELFNN